MKNFLFYANYEKFPWDMGYPVYEEINNILPWMIRQWNQYQKLEAEKAQTMRNSDRDGR